MEEAEREEGEVVWWKEGQGEGEEGDFAVIVLPVEGGQKEEAGASLRRSGGRREQERAWRSVLGHGIRVMNEQLTTVMHSAVQVDARLHTLAHDILGADTNVAPAVAARVASEITRQRKALVRIPELWQKNEDVLQYLLLTGVRAVGAKGQCTDGGTRSEASDADEGQAVDSDNHLEEDADAHADENDGYETQGAGAQKQGAKELEFGDGAAWALVPVDSVSAAPPTQPSRALASGPAGGQGVFGKSGGGTGGADTTKYETVMQIFVHLQRDWGEHDGAHAVRIALYDRIVDVLQQEVPVATPIGESTGGDNSAAPPPWVLCPGSGLGRLAFDMAVRGYRVEANEYGAMMTAASFTLINDAVRRRQSFSCFPGLAGVDTPMDQLYAETQWRELTFPDASASASLSRAARAHLRRHPIQIVNAEFTQHYGSPARRGQFDAVVTSFFLDTAVDVMEYIATVANTLRPGGVWINVGPLHWHKQPPVPMAFDSLCVFIEGSGLFTLETSEIWPTLPSYSGEHAYSTKPEAYSPVFFVARRRDTNASAPAPPENGAPVPTNEAAQQLLEELDSGAFLTSTEAAPIPSAALPSGCRAQATGPADPPDQRFYLC